MLNTRYEEKLKQLKTELRDASIQAVKWSKCQAAIARQLGKVRRQAVTEKIKPGRYYLIDKGGGYDIPVFVKEFHKNSSGSGRYYITCISHDKVCSDLHVSLSFFDGDKVQSVKELSAEQFNLLK
jgi:hypothetical protein